MRADRLLSILLLLQTRGRITAGRLADMLEVSERTIYRDLDALSAAGIPVYAERGPGGGCALTDGYRTNLTGLTETEIRTLFVPGVHGPLADLGLGRVLEDALLKLMAALPSVHRHDAQRVRQRLLLDAAGWFRGEEPVPYLHTVQEAIWQDHVLLLTYRRPDGMQTERLVDPYGLVAKASIWYLVARDRAAEEMRVFRVSRISGAAVSGECFERPADFDLATYWAQWSHDFEASRSQFRFCLRISPEIAAILPNMYGESMRHELEQMKRDEQGWVTLWLTVESIEYACAQILGFGRRVEVLDPPELRERVIQTARAVVEFYGEES